MTENTSLTLPMEDEHFFHELTKLLPRLRRFALGITGSPSSGNQVVQAACQQALNRYSHMTPGTMIDRWLFGLVTEEGLAGPAPSVPYQLPASPNLTTVQMTESRGLVSHFLSKLETPDRVALIMVCVEGASYAEVAQRLAIQTDEVRTHLAQRRRELADILNPAANRDMSQLDDPTMTAYIDGELTAEEAQKSSILIHSAGAAITSLRHATTALRAAVNEPMHEPVPQLLLGLIDGRRAELTRREMLAERQFIRSKRIRTASLWVIGLCLAGAATLAYLQLPK